MSCTHKSYTSGREHCFRGPVAQGDNQNQMAHGGISYIETCSSCGAKRSVNQNGLHVEEGSWDSDSED